MKRKLVILGCLILATLFVAAGGLEPRNAYAFTQDPGPGDDGGGWTDPCRIEGCVTKVVCGQPRKYECWCFYYCNSGSTVKITPGICPGDTLVYSPC
ncbi:MAG TPA: hypothetical protein VGX68_21010 [Thermoanaerobaculia bacterium]|jgi:hypothetical protein|nr:hypothetical protein [Thermoanaerobaculia bacterium]